MSLLKIGMFIMVLLTGCSAEEPRKTSTQNEELAAVEDTNQDKELAEPQDSNEPTTDSETLPEIRFERDASYGSTDEVVVGDIATVAVDDQNRVFIADMDQTTIHVFQPDGSYLSSFGRQGKGPGEYSEVSPNTVMKFHSNLLYITDGFYEGRAHLYLLNDLSFTHTMKLVAGNKDDYTELEGYYPRQIYPLNNRTFLVSYRQSFSQYEDKPSRVYYVVQDSDGHILRGPVLKQKGLTYLVHEEGRMRRMHSFPFFSKPLLAVSDDDHLYAAKTEEFKIEVYNSKGKQLSTIQPPFDNRSFNKDKVLERYEKTNYMEQLGDGIALEMVREAENLPDAWPALETMFFDDEDRLWVATIVDDVEIYEWWILKKSGEVITKFEWPRDGPIELVRNGYMYIRETDEETGLQQIVRYQIGMDKI